jgi:hypothetical protein
LAAGIIPAGAVGVDDAGVMFAGVVGVVGVIGVVGVTGVIGVTGVTTGAAPPAAPIAAVGGFAVVVDDAAGVALAGAAGIADATGVVAAGVSEVMSVSPPQAAINTPDVRMAVR